jgi:endoglucanase
MALFPALSLLAADFRMKVTDNGYVDTLGFSVILYQSTFHPIFVDQKNTAMEMILHGQRIATNGCAPGADARAVGPGGAA